MQTIHYNQIGGGVDEVIGGAFTGSLNVLVWGIVLIVCVAVSATAIWYFGFYRRKFNIFVKVTSERSEDRNKEYFDKAAILHDRKRKKRYLRLRQTRVDLPLPKFNLFRNTNKGDYIEILRISEKNFRFLAPARIIKHELIKNDGKVYPVTLSDQKQYESDLSWIMQREKDNKDIIDPQGYLAMLLQYTPYIVGGIILIFMMWMMFRYAPQWMKQMEDLSRMIAEERAARESATVIGSVLTLWKKFK